MKNLIIGLRGTDNGLFIAPPGIDVETASDDELLVNISQKSQQVIMSGLVTSLPQTVLHGLGFKPLVIITTKTSDLGYGFGNVRPMSNYSYGPGTGSNVIVDNTSLQFSSTFSSIGYLVFNSALA